MGNATKRSEGLGPKDVLCLGYRVHYATGILQRHVLENVVLESLDLAPGEDEPAGGVEPISRSSVVEVVGTVIRTKCPCRRS